MASIAGATGIACAVPVDTLVAQAARRQVESAMPSPRNTPLDTIVVLMMENRSFDHYFGWHEGADARNSGLAYPDRYGRTVPTRHLAEDMQGCAYLDPDHSWAGGRFQFNGGRNDGFLMGNATKAGSDAFALGYYHEQDLPFIAPLARAYTLYDRYFCSIMGPTYLNRHYQWAAQCGWQKVNTIPLGNEQLTGFQWETIFDRARRRGVTARYYASDIPFSAVYGERGANWTYPISRFYHDAEKGRLPNIAFVDPPYKGDGYNGLQADEHPHGDIRLGQAFMSDVVHAFIDSPQYRRGALFINYDEWGGFFDHVAPPRLRDKRANPWDIDNDWGQLGFRVPAVAVSPFARGGKVSHLTLAHESILRLISYRFGLGNLNTRHKNANNIGRTLDFDRPDFDPPTLPRPEKVAASPCQPLIVRSAHWVSHQPGVSRGVRAPEPAHEPHDLVRLESSGLLERLGIEAPEATYEDIFRMPNGIRGAIST